jgi:hypothetical protein
MGSVSLVRFGERKPAGRKSLAVVDYTFFEGVEARRVIPSKKP